MTVVPSDMSALDACGFVQVPPSSPSGQPLWMTCDTCQNSDHFWVAEQIHCRCGASYDHALRPDGSEVALPDLHWVCFEDGPKQLATMEWDPTRVILLLSAFFGFAGLVLWGWLH